MALTSFSRGMFPAEKRARPSTTRAYSLPAHRVYIFDFSCCRVNYTRVLPCGQWPSRNSPVPPRHSTISGSLSRSVPSADLRSLWLVGIGTRHRSKCAQRSADYHPGRQSLGVGDPDQRGADDRTANHLAAGAGSNGNFAEARNGGAEGADPHRDCGSVGSGRRAEVSDTPVGMAKEKALTPRWGFPPRIKNC